MRKNSHLSLETKVQKYIVSKNLLFHEQAVLVGVSGGSDSMALLYTLYGLGYPIIAAHCNFGLRGQVSDEDEDFVRSTCQELGIPFYSKKYDTKKISIESKKGIQELARELRYQWWIDLCIELNIYAIGTAHHLDDQAETVLHRLIRGSGIRGIRGILPESRTIYHKEIKVIRPFLGVTKQEILDYIDQRKISWRLDQSNLSNDYTRNKIRHRVLPLLNELQPGASVHISEFADMVQLFEPQIQEWIQHLKKERTSVTEAKISIDTKGLIPSQSFLLLNEYGFNYDQCKEMLSAQTGAKFYSPDFELSVQADHVEIFRQHPSRLHYWEVNEFPFKFIYLDKEIELSFQLTNQEPIAKLEIKTESIAIRTWQAGDRMKPLGMKGQSKKIQDILTDKKISGYDKENAIVLVCGEEILWLYPGNTISESGKVMDANHNIMYITLKDHSQSTIVP